MKRDAFLAGWIGACLAATTMNLLGFSGYWEQAMWVIGASFYMSVAVYVAWRCRAVSDLSGLSVVAALVHCAMLLWVLGAIRFLVEKIT